MKYVACEYNNVPIEKSRSHSVMDYFERKY